MLSPKPFCLLQWNSRGIRQKSSWFNSFPFVAADIFVVQETFLKREDSFSMSGMCIYRKDRAGRGGGLMTAVSRGFPSSVVSFSNLDSPEVEELSVKVWTGCHWFTIVNLYAPEGKFSQVWLTTLSQQLQAPFLILGDFNVKHRAWGNVCNSPAADILFSWILENDLCLMNTRFSTHLAPSGSESLIDLSLASPDIFRLSETFVHPDCFGSDHFPILINVSGLGAPTSCRVTHTDWGSINSDLNMFLNHSPDVSIDLLHDRFKKSWKDHTVRIRTRKKDNPPWWDSSCAWLLGKKRQYLRLARTTLSRTAWLQYKQFSSKLRRHMKGKARAYWGSLCEHAGKGKLFRIFRAVSNRTNNFQSNLVLNVNGRCLADRQVQAEAFAANYAQALDLPCIPVDFSSTLDLWNVDFSIIELNDAIRNTKDTSPGEDGISASVFKSLNNGSRLRLLSLFNFFLHTGDIPACWRTATILPIWKCGRPKAQVSSYRPIALTAVGCKIMERMILRRIHDWVIEQDCFHARHFGFLPGKDCMKALQILFRDIQGARQQKKRTVAVKLDVNSAYDSVWREGLMYKMALLGIQGNCALWISRWLAERWIKVRWRGCSSSRVSCDQGVPQGSVLSPILFMIFMWDIFEVFDSGVQVVVYADDIVLYCSDFCLPVIIQKLQDSLHRIHTWCDYWKLEIRADKCAAIYFNRSSTFPDLNLRFNGTDIVWVKDIKILGLILSYNFTFHAHFGAVQQRCVKRLNILKIFTSHQWGARTTDLLQLANALIRGVLEYAAPLYRVACKSAVRSLDVLYNSSLRLASGLPKWTPILKLYRETGQVPLGYRRLFLLQSFFIRCVGSFYKSDERSLYVDEDFGWQIDGVVVRPSMLIHPVWPSGCVSDYVDIFIEDFVFQSRSYPPSLICASFSDTILNDFPDFQVIATDASKDEYKTSIGVWDATRRSGKAYLVHRLNSVFTAEALAIDMGLKFLVDHGRCIILSDSKSALQALQKINFRSPAVILQLFQSLIVARSRVERLVLVWVPGHVGIVANEKADSLAKFGPFSTFQYGGISPEDLSRSLKASMWSACDDWWQEGKYAVDSRYLGRGVYNLTRNRREDVFTARLRTLSMVTEHRLHRFNLRTSPLCSVCQVEVGTEFHYIFECRAFDAERSLLSHRMQLDLSRVSWNCFWAALENKVAFRLFLDLFMGSGRF